MGTYTISKTLRWQGEITDKMEKVMRMFGLTADRLADRQITYTCQLDIDDGYIVYITGPSGAGKSILLKEFEKAVSEKDKVNIAGIKLPSNKTLIDCIEGDFLSSLKLLSIAGLSDVFCILNQPSNLSDGQKYRFRLAMALATKKKFIFADEFCSNLDRITAATISYKVHKFAKRNGTVFFLASSHQDILMDLEPDVIVTKELSGETQVVYKERKNPRRI